MGQNRVFGGICTELLGSYDQESLSWRTLQTSFDWAEQMSLQVLPKSGMTANGLLYEQVLTELPIEERDGLGWHIPEKSRTIDGLLPTPTATGSEHRTQYAQGGRPLLHMILKSYKPEEDTGKKIVLNPQFVEWMMGYPEGWTELEKKD